MSKKKKGKKMLTKMIKRTFRDVTYEFDSNVHELARLTLEGKHANARNITNHDDIKRIRKFIKNSHDNMNNNNNQMMEIRSIRNYCFNACDSISQLSKMVEPIYLNIFTDDVKLKGLTIFQSNSSLEPSEGFIFECEKKDYFDYGIQKDGKKKQIKVATITNWMVAYIDVNNEITLHKYIVNVEEGKYKKKCRFIFFFFLNL